MNNKNTRRALLVSIVSLILCVSMFVGTTFAWFTDSVTSGKNTILAGNLDVELEYLDADGEWKPVKEDTNVFMENTYWEPGHTETVYLKISNKGTLALDYKLGVNIVEEVKSFNVYDEELILSNHILMGAVDGVEEAYDTRAEARAALAGKTVLPLTDGYATEGTLYAADNIPANIVDAASAEYVALVVYMPESVENEANYKTGCDVPTITLGINLYATQETYEEDSFNDQYDVDASKTAPSVPVEEVTLDAIDVFDVFGTGNSYTTLEDITIDKYTFDALAFSGEYPVDEYKDWTCDFFVSTDKPVEEGLILLGSYATYGWLGFWVPENDQPYEPTGLLGTVTDGASNWTYEGIHDIVQTFNCGLIDYNGNNTGVKVTVELRMTSPDTTQIITVREIEVILGQ